MEVDLKNSKKCPIFRSSAHFPEISDNGFKTQNGQIRVRSTDYDLKGDENQ